MKTNNIFLKIILVVLVLALAAFVTMQVTLAQSSSSKTQTNRNTMGQSNINMGMTQARYLVMINEMNGDCETNLKSVVNMMNMGRGTMDHGTGSMDHGSMNQGTSGSTSDEGTYGSNNHDGSMGNDNTQVGMYGDTTKSRTGGSNTGTTSGMYGSTNRRSMFMREWGCSSDDRTGYIITSANSETEALQMLPDSLRVNAKAIKLTEIGSTMKNTMPNQPLKGR